MILARVVGRVVATQKHECFAACKLLALQPIGLDGSDDGDEIVAVDTVGAGSDETVLVVIEGRSTSQAMQRPQSPANAAVVGIVDQIDLDSSLS